MKRVAAIIAQPPDSEFTHIAVDPQQSKGGAVWLEPVTDEEIR